MKQPKYKIGNKFWKMVANKPKEMMVVQVTLARKDSFGVKQAVYEYALRQWDERVEYEGVSGIDGWEHNVKEDAEIFNFRTRKALIKSL